MLAREREFGINSRARMHGAICLFRLFFVRCGNLFLNGEHLRCNRRRRCFWFRRHELFPLEFSLVPVFIVGQVVVVVQGLAGKCAHIYHAAGYHLIHSIDEVGHVIRNDRCRICVAAVFTIFAEICVLAERACCHILGLAIISLLGIVELICRVFRIGGHVSSFQDRDKTAQVSRRSDHEKFADGDQSEDQRQAARGGMFTHSQWTLVSMMRRSAKSITTTSFPAERRLINAR